MAILSEELLVFFRVCRDRKAQATFTSSHRTTLSRIFRQSLRNGMGDKTAAVKADFVRTKGKLFSYVGSCSNHSLVATVRNVDHAGSIFFWLGLMYGCHSGTKPCRSVELVTNHTSRKSVKLPTLTFPIQRAENQR